MSIIKTLEERGLLDTLTDPNVAYFLAQENRRVYLGIDPTAPGLHLGNFVGLKIMRHFQEYGHTPVILLGGATALIGDPKKDKERPLLSEIEVNQNIDAIKDSIKKILISDCEKTAPLFVNNFSWMKNMDMIAYLRDVGKFFRVSTMLAKESVKARLHSSEGISYTEMSYQILQAYDFCHLHNALDVCIQLGGSDQYGNITAGIELARKRGQKNLFGITNPLLVRADGKKFGKSEKGAVWLDANLCSAVDFYQHLLNVSDEDVVKFLKMLTFVPLQQIFSMEEKVKRGDLHPNELQKKLASTLTLFIHGQDGLDKALKVSGSSQPGARAFDVTKIHEIKESLGALGFPKKKAIGMSFLDLILEVQLLPSKGEIRRMIKNKGVYLNGINVLDANYVIEEKDLLENCFIFVSIGKKKSQLIQLEQ